MKPDHSPHTQRESLVAVPKVSRPVGREGGGGDAEVDSNTDAATSVGCPTSYPNSDGMRGRQGSENAAHVHAPHDATQHHSVVVPHTPDRTLGLLTWVKVLMRAIGRCALTLLLWGTTHCASQA